MRNRSLICGPERSYLANVSLAAGIESPAQKQTAKGHNFGTSETNNVNRFEAKNLTLFDGREPAEIRPPRLANKNY
ncbi:MAG: hypothetical protein ACR2QZ_02480 [Woeseiaceae bacterium]